MTVKVGEWVVSLVDEKDIVKGNKYRVDSVRSGGFIGVIDDAGNKHTLLEEECSTIAKPETSTNYNDGKWHLWSGEDVLPKSVHGESTVQYVWYDENTGEVGKSEGQADWDESASRPAWDQVLKFRVIKEHREAREGWVYTSDIRYDQPDDCEIHNFIHVREVIE